MIWGALLAGALTLNPIQPSPPPLLAVVQETGPEPSAYRGKFFNQADEAYRLCVGQREGRHQYWVTGSNGFFLGSYQMTHELARGAVWMMAKEWQKLYGKEQAREMRETLHDTKPTRWSREIWDQAFYTILNWEGRHSGAHHWAGGRYGCQP